MPEQSDLLDKETAAAYISTKDRPISVRKLELLATEGRISRSYIPGKRGKQVRFKREDLDRLKGELAGEAVIEQPAAALVRTNPAQADMRPIASNDVALALAMLVERIQDGPARPSVPVADKVSLTMGEAVELSGMNESSVRKLIASGRIRHDYNGPRGSLRLSKADLIKSADLFES
jgi:hypothetical protein